jgi:hypothetical protein
MPPIPIETVRRKLSQNTKPRMKGEERDIGEKGRR